jgi:hypothetical protein
MSAQPPRSLEGTESPNQIEFLWERYRTLIWTILIAIACALGGTAAYRAYAQSTIENLKVEGPSVWERFRGKERAIWYYRQITEAIERRGANSLTRRLRGAVETLESL